MKEENNNDYKKRFAKNNMNEEKKEPKERDQKEQRIRAITKLYYSNPKIIEAIAKFAKDREVVPRYYEGFGKRPDKIEYPSDIMGLANKGATSFHSSEELWNDPLSLSSEISKEEMNKLRKSWDLLIDIDSPFLDYSKIAANLLIDQLEKHGIQNYKIKFSGSKGFHIIVSGKAFPSEYDGLKAREMFPEWPRAICEYLINLIRPKFNELTYTEEDVRNIINRNHLKKEDVVESICPECNFQMKQDKLVRYKCVLCGNEIKLKKSFIAKRRVIRCNLDDSPTKFVDEEDFIECPKCKISDIKMNFKEGEKISSEGRKAAGLYREDVRKSIKEEMRGNLDLVLVAPRHLFRMPYSLHEKTALASIVLRKDQIDSFSPRDADPLRVKIFDFMPENFEGEGKRLLTSALEWKKNSEKEEEKTYKKYDGTENLDIEGVSEDMFPKPIKKLLLGLKEGKKRGLFILLSFLKSLNFPPDYINQKAREWNKLNDPPLREGYVKSQIEWHLRQKRRILPPNYDNPGFYKDMGLLDYPPKEKNPISEVIKQLRKRY